MYNFIYLALIPIGYYILNHFIKKYFFLRDVKNYMKSLRKNHKVPDIDKDDWKELDKTVYERFQKEFQPKMVGQKPETVLIQLSKWLSTTIRELAKDLTEKKKKNKVGKKEWHQLLSQKAAPIMKKKKVMTRNECQPDKMREFISELYRDLNCNEEMPDYPGIIKDDIKVTNPFDMSPFKEEEILNVLKIDSTTRDPFGIYYEVFRNLTSLHPFLCETFTDLMKSGGRNMDFRWKHTTVFMQYKKDDPKDPKNYRPIILMGIVVKIFHKILNKRIYDYILYNGILDTRIQKGLQRNFNGVVENVIISRELVGRARKEGKSLSMLFLDLENAYGSLRHPFIAKVLKEYNFPPAIQDYIKNFYHQATAHVLIDNKNTDPFYWQKGIFQGCSLSNVLFILCMNYILVHVDRKFHSLGYPLGKTNTLLMAFVDDLAIIARKSSDILIVLKELEKMLSWAGFKLKPRKSRILEINQKPTNFYIDGNLVERIGNAGEFKYLGSIITESGDENVTYQKYGGELESKLKFVDEMIMGKQYKIKNKDKLYLFSTHIATQVRWQFVNNIWSNEVRSKIEDLEIKYLSKWAEKKSYQSILDRRRKMVDKRREYVYKCSLDDRIQELSMEMYGPVTQSEKDLVKQKIDEMLNVKCQFYSRLDED